jgi:hypothetical protein
MQQFDITVTSAGAFVVHAPGRYIKYLAGSNGGGDASLTVTPGGQGGSKIMLQPGQAYRISDKAPTPDSWTLQNAAGGATIIGKVVIGDGRIDDNTLSGVVSTLDGSKARTLAGMAFASTNATGIPAAGKFAMLQLWNPAASGKRLVIESISLLGGAGAVAVNVVTTNVQTGALLPGNPAPKLAGLGVATSVAAWYFDITTQTVAPVASNVMFQFDAQASSVFPFQPKEPVVIPPGCGMLFGANAAATNLAVMLEWYEEPNV